MLTAIELLNLVRNMALFGYLHPVDNGVVSSPSWLSVEKNS